MNTCFECGAQTENQPVRIGVDDLVYCDDPHCLNAMDRAIDLQATLDYEEALEAKYDRMHGRRIS